MSAFIRLLVICLVALSVPLQGMAAVTMACHQAADAEDERGTAMQAHGHHAMHQGMDHSGHHGKQADTQHAMGSDVSTAQAAAPDHTAHAGWGSDARGTAAAADHAGGGLGHSCSTCSACCLAAAILNMPWSVQAVSLAPTVFDAVVPAVAHFAVDGPDRPPRPFAV